MLPTVVAPSKEPGVLDLPHHPIISQDPRQWVPSGCWPKTTGQTTGGGATIINVELSIGKYNSSHVYSHNNYIDWAAAAAQMHSPYTIRPERVQPGRRSVERHLPQSQQTSSSYRSTPRTQTVHPSPRPHQPWNPTAG